MIKIIVDKETTVYATEMNSTCIMGQQNTKQDYKIEDGTWKYGKHHQREKVEVDGTFFSYGWRWKSQQSDVLKFWI